MCVNMDIYDEQKKWIDVLNIPSSLVLCVSSYSTNELIILQEIRGKHAHKLIK